MSVLSSIFLGLVQGVAEFLPISSSGHLSLFQNFFGLVSAEGSLFFDVLLHLGTLIAVFVYYWKDIVALVKEFFHLIACVFSREKRRQMKRLPPNGRLILMIIVATLPLFVILPIKDKVEGLYGNTIFVGCALAVTGCILFFSDRMARGKKAQVCHHAGCSAGGRGPGGGGGARPLPVGDHHLGGDDAGVSPAVRGAVFLPAVHPSGAGGQYSEHWRGCAGGD